MPPTQIRWISATGDWAAPGSWSTGVVPVDTDEVLFDGTSQVSVTAGLNQTTVDLTSLTILPAYRGNIAASGGSLRITTQDLIIRGDGQYFIKGESDGAAVIDNIVIDARRARLTLDGKAHRIYNKRGYLIVAPTADDITLLTMHSMQSVATIYYAAGNTLATLILERGTVTNEREITTRAVVSDGTLTQSRHGTMLELTQYGGSFVYDPSLFPLANPAIGTLNLFGGTADFSTAGEIVYVTYMITGPNAHIIEGSFGVTKNSYWEDLRVDIPIAGP